MFCIATERSFQAWRCAAAAVLIGLIPARHACADTAAGLADFQRGAFAEAYQEWHAAAAVGDARGALFVGVLYDTGEGVVPNEAEALAWYGRAAEAGSPPGAFNVAVMYDSGRGTPRDPVKAAEWYARASDLGYARADYNLALMLDNGDGVARDHARATMYFRRAAGRGIVAARTHLASLEQPLKNSPQVAGDAMQDFAEAQKLLMSRGPADAARAAELFTRAAAQNNALAEYDLGYCYEHGMGVPRSLVRAGELYRRAAAHSADEGLRSIALSGARNLDGKLTQQASQSSVSRSR